MSKTNRFRRARRRKPTRQAQRAPVTEAKATSTGQSALSRFINSEDTLKHTREIVAQMAAEVGGEAGAEEYEQLHQQIQAFVDHWKLTDAEAAGLVRVDEAAWQSGEWRNQCDGELVFRMYMVRALVEGLEAKAGYPRIMRWLREPESARYFGGAIPLQLLTMPDTARVLAYIMMAQMFHDEVKPDALGPKQSPLVEEERKRMSPSSEWAMPTEASSPEEASNMLVGSMMRQLRDSPEAEAEASTGTGSSDQQAAEFARLVKRGIEPSSELRAHVKKAGLYPNFPIGPEERDELNEKLVAIRGVLTGSAEAQTYLHVVREMKEVMQHWQLSDAEAARLINVEDEVWSSGAWMNQLNAERVYRFLLATRILEWMDRSLGHEVAMRWLRAPDRNTIFGGVVPMEELSQRDLVRLNTYSLFVKQVYAPDVDWLSGVEGLVAKSL